MSLLLFALLIVLVAALLETLTRNVDVDYEHVCKLWAEEIEQMTEDHNERVT